MKKIVIIFGAILCANVAYADTETIRWSADGTVTTTTCQSGGAVTLPATPPNKRGYTFAGWQEIDPSIAPSTYTYDAANMTWSATFSYGTVSGTALCSVTSGSYPNVGNPDESTTGNTRHCWCRATHPVLSHWVFRNAYGSAADCSPNCADVCGFDVRYYAGFRSSMFGSVAP